MLTDLNFLNTGQKWPPPSEAERLSKYSSNRQLFEGRHDIAYADQFKRITRVVGNYQEVVQVEILVNFHQLLSKKVADLLFGEPPKYICGKVKSSQQQSIDKIKENSDLDNTGYMVSLDISRYGDGLFYVRHDGKKGVIDVTQPSIWFPVIDPKNVRVVLYHVLAWTYDVGTGKDKKTYLYCQIHSKGQFEERTYLLKDGFIEVMTEDPTVKKTGLDDFAIVRVPNLLTSDRIFGIDDYTDIDSIMAEIEVRLSQIAKILDKHAEPSMQGPASALRYDSENDSYSVKAGDYFIVEDQEGKVEYIVWDAELDANFKFLEMLQNFLFMLSETGAAVFGDFAQKTGQVPSGSALRRLMINILAKVNRVRLRFDPALKKAIKLCSQLGGEGIANLSKEDVSIQWNDGLPGDPKEEAEIMQTRTGSKATMSQRRALKQFDGMSDEDADNELAEIQAEEMAINPTITPPFGGGEE